MGKLNDAFVCKCVTPRLQRHIGEDTGLCGICGFVYDEPLYWMRVQQHVSGVSDFADLDEFLRGEINGQPINPQYAALAND